MRVSVLIPTFNRPAATMRAVRSALAQTWPVHEVVVVDDASSPPLARAPLESLDQRVKVSVLPANRGAAATRQRAVDLCTGDVLAFLDSDDVWHPRKIERQLPLLAGGVLCAVACGWREDDEAGAPLRERIPAPSSAPLDFFSGCWFSPGSTVLLPRAAFDKIGPFDTRLRRLEDFEWFARFGLAGGMLRVLPEVEVTVSIGSRARLAPVGDAARAILDTLKRNPSIPAEFMNAARAWLDVERARAALNDRKRLPAGAFLLRSLVRRPRATVHLRNWWPRPTGFGSNPEPSASTEGTP